MPARAHAACPLQRDVTHSDQFAEFTILALTPTFWRQASSLWQLAEFAGAVVQGRG